MKIVFGLQKFRKEAFEVTILMAFREKPHLFLHYHPLLCAVVSQTLQLGMNSCVVCGSSKINFIIHDKYVWQRYPLLSVIYAGSVLVLQSALISIRNISLSNLTRPSGLLVVCWAHWGCTNFGSGFFEAVLARPRSCIFLAKAHSTRHHQWVLQF